MMKKILILLLITSSFALAAQKVLITKKNIQYKDIIQVEDIVQKNTYKAVARNCLPVTKEVLENGVFIALHYIRKSSILCSKDIKRYVRKSVKFDFGSFEIEKTGEIILETNDFVKIKTKNGKVEKIYKDGHRR